MTEPEKIGPSKYFRIIGFVTAVPLSFLMFLWIGKDVSFIEFMWKSMVIMTPWIFILVGADMIWQVRKHYGYIPWRWRKDKDDDPMA
jgi:hypothetical protein